MVHCVRQKVRLLVFLYKKCKKSTHQIYFNQRCVSCSHDVEKTFIIHTIMNSWTTNNTTSCYIVSLANLSQAISSSMLFYSAMFFILMFFSSMFSGLICTPQCMHKRKIYSWKFLSSLLPLPFFFSSFAEFLFLAMLSSFHTSKQGKIFLILKNNVNNSITFYKSS